MKKFLVILLLMVYGLSSSGMTLHFHYCCGKLEKINLEPVTGSGCGKTHKNLHNKPCCENKSVELKVSPDQKISSISLANFTSPAAINSVITPVPVINFNNRVFKPDSGPPVLSSSSLLILNCVFRI